MKSNIDFINTDITKALLKLFVPLMLAMTLTMAYSMVDSLWVGNLLGEAGLSALTASTAIVLIMNSLSMGVGNGVSVMIAQLVGAKDKAGIQRAAAVIITVSLLFSASMCVAGEFLAEYILTVMGTPSEVLPEAVSYLRLYLISNAALFLYMQFTSIFRAFGDSMFQMKGMLITVIVNAVLDPLMIRVWGFNGVAIATVVSEVMCLLYAIWYHHNMLTSCVQGYITGMGRPEMAMMLLIAYYIVFRIPAAILLKISMGLSGVWIAFLVSHVMACVLAFAILYYIRERQRAPQRLCYRV